MLSALAASMSVAQARMDAWRKKRIRLAPIEELPDELLAKIAWNIPLRHSEGGYVVEATDLASFSAVSLIMRAVTLPILFSRVPISSQRLMLAFTDVPTYLLRFVREVSIFMDAEFMDAWAEWAFAGMEDRGSKPSPYLCLAHILAHCTGLETLRIRVAELSGARSGWGKFALSRGFAIPIGRALADALSLWPRASLSRLKTLELDGFQCIGPLLRISPNIESLHLCLSGGFPQSTNAELVRSLKFVPKLRHLTYTPESLHLHTLSSEIFPPIGDDDDIVPVGDGSNSELIKALGTTLPQLETLNLQTRFFGDDIYFCSPLNPLDAGTLIEAMEHFNCLKRLALPTSVYTSTDFFTLRGLTTPLDDRRRTLEDISSAERRVVEQIANNARHIQTISFVRPSVAHERRERAVVYSNMSVHADSAMSRHCIAYTCEVAEAGEGQSDPWPFTQPVRFKYALRKIWNAPLLEGRELAILYVQDHDELSRAMMGLEGCVLGGLFRGAEMVTNVVTWWTDHAVNLGVKSLSFFS